MTNTTCFLYYLLPLKSSLDNEMKTSNISEETMTTNNETTESNSDTNSENYTKLKSSVSETEENSDENLDSSSNKQNLSLNYDRLSTKDYLKTQTPTSNRPASRRSLDHSTKAKVKDNKIDSVEELLSKEAKLKVSQVATIF